MSNSFLNKDYLNYMTSIFKSDEEKQKERELALQSNLGLLNESNEQNKFLGYQNDPRFMDSFFENTTTNSNITNIDKVYETKSVDGSKMYSLNEPTIGKSKLVPVDMDNKNRVQNVVNIANNQNAMRGDKQMFQINPEDMSPRGQYLSKAAEPYSKEQQAGLLVAEENLLNLNQNPTQGNVLSEIYNLEKGGFSSNEVAKEISSLSPATMITLMSALGGTSSNKTQTPIAPIPVATRGQTFGLIDPYEKYRRRLV